MMPAPFRVGSVVELSPVGSWGTRERWPNGPCVGERYVVSRHDDYNGTSFIRDDKGEEWLVSAHPESIWHVVQILDYPGLTAWREAVAQGKTIDGYNEWAKAQQKEALES